MAIRVLLADDHVVVCEGLKMILSKQNDIAVVGSATNGREVVKLAFLCDPNVVVMDICMPELNGIDAAYRIRELDSSIQIVFLSMYATKEYIYRAMKSGAMGYILKESAGDDIVRAIYAVHSGQRFFSTELKEIIIDHHVFKSEDLPSKSPLDCLSSREREILQLVVEGKSSSEIGKIVHLSRTTVETYRSRLMTKLDIGNVPDLVRFAIQHGLTRLTR